MIAIDVRVQHAARLCHWRFLLANAFRPRFGQTGTEHRLLRRSFCAMDLLGHRLVRLESAFPKPPGWGILRASSCATISICFPPCLQVDHSLRRKPPRPSPYGDCPRGEALRPCLEPWGADGNGHGAQLYEHTDMHTLISTPPALPLLKRPNHTVFTLVPVPLAGA